ncbi:MAG: hypothetical protein JWM20_846 [Patescibacteria group bacterium]|nr:hypothetical protein [Patescibacteria group bacterium]
MMFWNKTVIIEHFKLKDKNMAIRNQDKTVIVTYGGSLMKDYSLISERCESVCDAVEQSETDKTYIILAAGFNPKEKTNKPFKELMAEDIEIMLEGKRYERIADGMSADLVKGEHLVKIMPTAGNHWGTLKQTEAMLHEIGLLKDVKTIHVVITEENIPQLKFIWRLFYKGDAKLEFSGKPRGGRSHYYRYVLENLRKVRALLYWFFKKDLERTLDIDE